MSSLHDTINRRKAAESPNLDCVELQPQATTLVLSLWNGSLWILPWSHFTGARFGGEHRQEELELTFTRCIVLITGTQLRRMAEDLAAFRVACLREISAEYAAYAEGKASFISRIEVRSNQSTREIPGQTGESPGA